MSGVTGVTDVTDVTQSLPAPPPPPPQSVIIDNSNPIGRSSGTAGVIPINGPPPIPPRPQQSVLIDTSQEDQPPQRQDQPQYRLPRGDYLRNQIIDDEYFFANFTNWWNASYNNLTEPEKILAYTYYNNLNQTQKQQQQDRDMENYIGFMKIIKRGGRPESRVFQAFKDQPPPRQQPRDQQQDRSQPPRQQQGSQRSQPATAATTPSTQTASTGPVPPEFLKEYKQSREVTNTLTPFVERKMPRVQQKDVIPTVPPIDPKLRSMRNQMSRNDQWAVPPQIPPARRTDLTYPGTERKIKPF